MLKIITKYMSGLIMFIGVIIVYGVPNMESLINAFYLFIFGIITSITGYFLYKYSKGL